MIRDSFNTADGCKLEFEIAGTGAPVLWQHGLGAAFSQPAAVFPMDCGLQRITLACRGHEGSDLGDASKLTIATFAEDALALLDHLGIKQVAAGGISLGAALSLRLATLQSTRINKLVLARPAWVDGPSIATMRIYVEVAQIIRNYGLSEGRKRLQSLPEFQALMSASPDNAKSAESFFTRARPENTVELLSRIPLGSPGVSRDQISRIAVPALVIGSGDDVVHPLSYAEALAELIPQAKLQVITSKTVDAAAYEREFKAALFQFLAQ